jgi:hypothetical protein
MTAQRAAITGDGSGSLFCTEKLENHHPRKEHQEKDRLARRILKCRAYSAQISSAFCFYKDIAATRLFSDVNNSYFAFKKHSRRVRMKDVAGPLPNELAIGEVDEQVCLSGRKIPPCCKIRLLEGKIFLSFRVRDSSGRQGHRPDEPATGEAATKEATAADGRPGDEVLTTSG